MSDEEIDLDALTEGWTRKSTRKRTKPRRIEEEESDAPEDEDPIAKMLREQEQEERKLNKARKEEKALDEKAKLDVDYLDMEKETEAEYNDLIKNKNEEDLADKLPPQNLTLWFFQQNWKQVPLPTIEESLGTHWNTFGKILAREPINALCKRQACEIAARLPQVLVPPSVMSYFVDLVLYNENLQVVVSAAKNLVGILYGTATVTFHESDPRCLQLGKAKRLDAWRVTPKMVEAKLTDFGLCLDKVNADETASETASPLEQEQGCNLEYYLRIVELYIRAGSCDNWTPTECMGVVKQLYCIQLDTQLHKSYAGACAAVLLETILGLYNAEECQAFAETFAEVVTHLTPKVLRSENQLLDRTDVDDEMDRFALSLTLLEHMKGNNPLSRALRCRIAIELCHSKDLVKAEHGATLETEIRETSKACGESPAFEEAARALGRLATDIRKVHRLAKDKSSKVRLVPKDYHRWVLFLRAVGFIEREIEATPHRKKQMRVICDQYVVLQNSFVKKFHLAFTHLQDLIASRQCIYSTISEDRRIAHSSKKKQKQLNMSFFAKPKTPSLQKTPVSEQENKKTPLNVATG